MDAHPYHFCPPCRFSPLWPISKISPSSLCSISIIGALQHSMIPAQVQCWGCDKVFTPCGLSQHTSKSQNIRCCHINHSPLDNLDTPSILCMVSRSASPLNHIPEVIGNDQPGNEYHPTINQDLDNVPKLGEASSNSTSFMTQGGDIFLLCIEIWQVLYS